MQRLFSIFPSGGPGIGLLLLRISVAVTLVFDIAHWTGVFPAHPIFVGALLIALALIVGLMTPYLAFIVCAFAVVNLIGDRPLFDKVTAAFLVLVPAALALLGPGAYSVDARLFGRRVVVMPPHRDPNER